MDITIPVGSYVVAVSGGVDSMALLHLLATTYGPATGHRFVVAHYDHGIRGDSVLDRQLVQQVAHKHGLQFVYEEGNLGIATSEADARDKRYAFLRTVQAAALADAIVTAHHQDDVLETAILNLLRGTNRRGLTSLTSSQDVRRPLLRIGKQELIAYAKTHGLIWHEDSTNSDDAYRRNYVRHEIVAKLDPAARQKLLDIIAEAADRNAAIDDALADLLPEDGKLDRTRLVSLPHAIARELIALWLRQQGVREYDKKALERIVVGAKTLPKGSQIEVNRQQYILVGKDNLALKLRDR